MWKMLRNPDLYHGHGKTSNFFEGWYFKVVDPTERHVFAFIPGIFMGKNPGESHSFVQLVSGSGAWARYMRYPVTDFSASRNEFEITVSGHSFSLAGIKLNVADTQTSVSGQLFFSNIMKWPDTLLNPGSMGFYNYLPKMQCYSQVCAMDMDLSGALTINGKMIDFSGGKGYIEKNWGSAFPYSWVWIQSNNFSATRASVSCSLGHVPMLFGSFRGFLIGLYVDHQFYSFTTMNRSQLSVQKSGADICVHTKNRYYSLTMETKTQPEQFILLDGPRDGKMVPVVQENLKGKVILTLTENSTKKIVFKDEGRSAGIEYGGEQMLVLD
jgi:tocopherol cyclase